MRLYIRIALLVLILLGIATVITVFIAAPVVRDISPADGQKLQSSDVLKITFSRRLNAGQAAQALQMTPPVPGQTSWSESENALLFTPASGWPAGVNITVTLRSGVQAAAFPQLRLRGGGEWHFYTQPSRMVFLWPNSGPANLYLYQTGREPRRITNLPGGILDYALHSDASTARLYFSASTPQGSDIYLLELPAGLLDADKLLPEPQKVSTCPQASCQGLSLSPAGRYLAYERILYPAAQSGASGPQVEYIALSQDGRRVESGPSLAGPDGHQTILPAWSSEELLSIYDSAAKAYLFIEIPTKTTLRAISNDTGQPGAWQPGGSVFVAAEINELTPTSGGPTGLERLADSHLLRYDPSTGQSTDLTAEPGLEDAAPAFSPDGGQLAFARKYLDVRRWTPGRQLWVMTPDGKNARPLTDEPIYTHFDFAWNAAGNLLAYVRFNQSALSEPPEVWFIDLATGKTQQVSRGGYAPQWLP